MFHIMYILLPHRSYSDVHIPLYTNHKKVGRYNISTISFIIFPPVSVPQNREKGFLCSLERKWLYQRIKRSCRKKLLYKRIPIAAWIPKYRKDYIVSDLVAGITVGLTVIPQAIAYANVAGLPLQVRQFARSLVKFYKFNIIPLYLSIFIIKLFYI